jgi:hypothetical protein
MCFEGLAFLACSYLKTAALSHSRYGGKYGPNPDRNVRSLLRSM